MNGGREKQKKSNPASCLPFDLREEVLPPQHFLREKMKYLRENEVSLSSLVVVGEKREEKEEEEEEQ